MQIFIGQAELKGDFSRYVRQFQVLEIGSDAGRLPKAARLRSWKAAAPQGFVFSLVLPASVALLEANERSKEEREQALAAAELVNANWLLLRTPPSVRPSARSRDRLASLIEQLKVTNRRLAWEPSGLWDEAQALPLATSLGLTLVRDLTREEPPSGSQIYTRIRAMGTGASVGAGLVQRLAERLSQADECIVIVEGEGATRVKRFLSDELLFLNDEDELEVGLE